MDAEKVLFQIFDNFCHGKRGLPDALKITAILHLTH